MDDLIWIGNTLYPRWVVFFVVGLIIALIAGVFATIASKVK
jgi:spore maturation protein SpmA